MSARDPASTDADPSSGGPDDDGRTAAVGPVAPVLPPGYRTVVALRALRLGALVAGAVLLGLLRIERQEVVLLDSLRLGLLTACIAIVLIGIGTAARDRIGRAHTAVAGLFATGIAMAAAAWLVRMWWAAYRECTITSSVYLIAAALLLALGVLVVAGVLLRRARTRLGARRRAPDDPARWRRLYGPAKGEGRPETTCKDELPHSRLSMWADSLRLLIAEIPRPVLPTHESLVLRARTRALLAVVALLPALALAAGALVPATLLKPVARTTAPAGSEPPARPTALGGGIAWTYDADFIDVVAGAAGPIVLTPEGVTALNGEDGSVRWTYRRDTSYVNGHGEQVDRHSPPYSENALTASPDARHVAVRIEGPGIIVSVVLDSTTGEVTAEHRSTFRSPLQMTDSLAVDGNEAFALDGGKTLWTMPEGTFGRRDSGSWDNSYSGTAGHSTVIVGMEKSCLTDNRFCKTSRTLRVAPDHDPTATTEITHVLRGIGPEYNSVENVTVVDGWVARSTDDDARTTPDEYADLAWETQAVNLDALASGEEAAPVPLGSASGMNTVASHASGTLVTATLLDRPAKNDVIDESTVSWAEAVLDPATGTATPASEYPGLAAARVGLRTTVVDTQATTSVVIEPAGGGPGVSAPVPPGTLIEPWKPADSRNDAENETENDAEPLGKASSNVIAMTVPGATTIVIRSKLSASDLPIVSLIYGMAGEDR